MYQAPLSQSPLCATSRFDIVDQNRNGILERYEQEMGSCNHRIVAGHQHLRALDYEIAREEEQLALVQRTRRFKELELKAARDVQELNTQGAALQAMAHAKMMEHQRLTGRLGEVAQATQSTDADWQKMRKQNEAYVVRNQQDVSMRKNIFLDGVVGAPPTPQAQAFVAQSEVDRLEKELAQAKAQALTNSMYPGVGPIANPLLAPSFPYGAYQPTLGR